MSILNTYYNYKLQESFIHLNHSEDEIKNEIDDSLIKPLDYKESCDFFSKCSFYHYSISSAGGNYSETTFTFPLNKDFEKHNLRNIKSVIIVRQEKNYGTKIFLIIKNLSKKRTNCAFYFKIKGMKISESGKYYEIKDYDLMGEKFKKSFNIFMKNLYDSFQKFELNDMKNDTTIVNFVNNKLDFDPSIEAEICNYDLRYS